jgi:hypothetical protein
LAIPLCRMRVWPCSRCIIGVVMAAMFLVNASLNVVGACGAG